MTALFTVLAIDAYRSQRDNVTALLTLISGTIGIILAPRFHASGVDGNLHCPADNTVLHRKIAGNTAETPDTRPRE